MNKYQQQSVEFLIHHITERLDSTPKYDDQISVFETDHTEYGTVWITLQTEMLGLPENNMLRVLSHEYWHVHIGKRGKIEAYSYPKSYEQFKGRKVFTHIHFVK